MPQQVTLVTGGAGYIGSHAVLALKDHGWRPVVVDDLSTGNRNLVPGDVPFYEGSVADQALLKRIISECDISAIMHFAGSISVPESVEKPLDYYRNNTITTHSLISSAVECGVKHILFSSTAAVYGDARKVPIEETDETAPINPYGASKLMTERMLADCAAAYGFNYGALRYFNVAGADPLGRSGQAGRGLNAPDQGCR
jgi:UDP-glucose 4-epimerase